MKVNIKMMYNAIAGTLFDVYSSTEIANKVVDVINDDRSGAVEVYNTRGNGFVLRCRKDCNIGDTYLHKVLADVTAELFDDKSDEAMDHMSDTFDMTYEEKYVTADYAKDIFEISHNGRLIYIEADL